jgi:murein DD-endopeptidase MepM/ murein hydrolase activator NlpD
MKKISLIVAIVLLAFASIFTYFHTHSESALDTAYSTSTPVASTSTASAGEAALVTNAEPGLPDTSAQDESVDTSNSTLFVSPAKVVQGSPMLVTINGTADTDIKSLTFMGKKAAIINWQGKPSAIIGVDLRASTGTYPLVLTLKDGTVIKKNVVIAKRTIAQEELGIPDKLGGNTEAGVQNVTSTLIADNNAISTVVSTSTQLWSSTFRYPIDGAITITDPYGDTRITVSTTIAHKGADFRAAIGTPVYAMNDGRVAFASSLNTYGNTIVIDHGLGLQTIYMHLSEFEAKVGDMVKRGDLIAKSGDTGYVLGPHLHLSIKLNGVSIDPLEFMALLGASNR